MERYQDKKVVIIGGTSGMGLTTAKMLLDGGARVLVTGRSQAGLDSARQALGEGAIVVSSDARSLTDIDALAAQVPSDLLRRRPDIRQAERTLAASVADVDQATAALYPQLQLTGSYDLISTALKTLLEAASQDYVAGAALAQPLFDGGKLRAQKHEAEEEAVQSSIAYRKAALVAFQQTADALALYSADQRRLVALRGAYVDEARSTNLNRAQYLGGIADLQGTLRAEAVALHDQDQLIQTEGQLCQDLVSLYRALGGGWSQSDTIASLPPKTKNR
jgi:multidrug efflux system outer membrane protein